MPRRSIITTAFVATAVLAIGPATGAPAKSTKTTSVSCTIELFAQGAPNPSGIHFGFTECSKPFGAGLHFNEYTVTPTGPGTGSVVAAFKNYYNRGTTRGTAALTFAATGPGAVTYTGTLTYTGGTGKFRHVRGRGTIRCTTSDGGAHKRCTVRSTLTGV